MKKKNNLLILVDTIEKFDELGSLDVSFLFPLQDFSLGQATFKLGDIPECNAYLFLNRLLDCKAIDDLESVLTNIPTFIKGIVFEDIGVFELLKNSSLELIWFQNHYGTNSEIVNYWNDLGVESCVLSYDITKEKQENICKTSKKPVVLKIFGYNQILYSRRELLSNYQDNFNLDRKKSSSLKEAISNLEFIIQENDYGTVILNKKIFDGRVLLDMHNVKYFFIDTTDIDIQIIKDLLTSLESGVDNISKDLIDNGFLYRETIYKLKEEGVK